MLCVVWCVSKYVTRWFFFICYLAPRTPPKTSRCPWLVSALLSARTAHQGVDVRRAACEHSYQWIVYGSALRILSRPPSRGKSCGSRSHRPSTSSKTSADLHGGYPPPPTMMHPATAAHAKRLRVSCIGGRGDQCPSSPSVSASHEDVHAL